LVKINLLAYLLEGVWHPGKKVLETILEICPRVALLHGRKYGLHSRPYHSNYTGQAAIEGPTN
jgi:hypothetical protein